MPMAHRRELDEFTVDKPLDDATLGVVVKDTYQSPIFGINNKVTACPAQPNPLKTGKVVCRLPEILSMAGVYPLRQYGGNRIRAIAT